MRRKFGWVSVHDVFTTEREIDAWKVEIVCQAVKNKKERIAIVCTLK